MGTGSGRAHCARIKQDDNGDFYVSFRGGYVAHLRKGHPGHVTLKRLVEQIWDDAEPSQEMLDSKKFKAKQAIRAAKEKLAAAEAELRAAEAALDEASRPEKESTGFVIAPGSTAHDGQLEHGLYRIHWKTGGSSLASVGSTTDGTRWLAPTNWVSGPTTDWSNVKSVNRVF